MTLHLLINLHTSSWHDDTMLPDNILCSIDLLESKLACTVPRNHFRAHTSLSVMIDL